MTNPSCFMAGLYDSAPAANPKDPPKRCCGSTPSQRLMGGAVLRGLGEEPVIPLSAGRKGALRPVLLPRRPNMAKQIDGKDHGSKFRNIKTAASPSMSIASLSDGLD